MGLLTKLPSFESIDDDEFEDIPLLPFHNSPVDIGSVVDDGASIKSYSTGSLSNLLSHATIMTTTKCKAISRNVFHKTNRMSRRIWQTTTQTSKALLNAIQTIIPTISAIGNSIYNFFAFHHYIFICLLHNTICLLLWYPGPVSHLNNPDARLIVGACMISGAVVFDMLNLGMFMDLGESAAEHHERNFMHGMYVRTYIEKGCQKDSTLKREVRKYLFNLVRGMTEIQARKIADRVERIIFEDLTFHGLKETFRKCSGFCAKKFTKKGRTHMDLSLFPQEIGLSILEKIVEDYPRYPQISEGQPFSAFPVSILSSFPKNKSYLEELENLYFKHTTLQLTPVNFSLAYKSLDFQYLLDQTTKLNISLGWLQQPSRTVGLAWPCWFVDNPAQPRVPNPRLGDLPPCEHCEKYKAKIRDYSNFLLALKSPLNLAKNITHLNFDLYHADFNVLFVSKPILNVIVRTPHLETLNFTILWESTGIEYGPQRWLPLPPQPTNVITGMKVNELLDAFEKILYVDDRRFSMYKKEGWNVLEFNWRLKRDVTEPGQLRRRVGSLEAAGELWEGSVFW